MDRYEADDFKFFFAGGRGHFDLIADFFVEKSFADGRGGGDETLFGFGFFGRDQLVVNLHVFLGVEDGEARTVAGAVLGDIGEIEHTEVAHAFFELADAGVDVALAFFGVLVLGVFREVAVGPGDGDFFGKIDVQFVRELFNFVLQFFLNLG